MLVIHNWYKDWVYVAFDETQAKALTLKQRRLRAFSRLQVVYDADVAKNVPSAENLDVWGGLWRPEVEDFVTAVGETRQRVDCWFGSVSSPRRLGPAWQAHADLRQEKILARPCQLTLLPFSPPMRRQRVGGRA